jgi:CBS domain-containing protein
MPIFDLINKLQEVFSELFTPPRSQVSLPVKEFMTREVATCGPEATLDTIARLMWDKDCGAVPIIGGAGEVIGVVTDRDIALGCSLNQKAPWDITARDVWNNRQVFTCQPDDDIHSALQMIAECRVRRLLIVDDNHRLQGILSADDIVAWTEKAVNERTPPALSCKETMTMLKAVCIHR